MMRMFHTTTFLLFAGLFPTMFLSSMLVVQSHSTFQMTTRTLAFAAAKKSNRKSSGGGGKKKKNSASSNRGFGIAPPTYEEVLSTFSTRIPSPSSSNNEEKPPDEYECPCGIVPGRLYGDCCGPIHRGEQTCQTITDVLKSRYSAFAWRNIDHIIQTTHTSCRDYQDDKIAWAKSLDKSGMFDSYEFISLQAGNEELPSSNDGSNENKGFIEFEVTLRDKGEKHKELKGKETIVKERSKFIRNPSDGVWSYVGGEVRTNVAGLEDTILNN